MLLLLGLPHRLWKSNTLGLVETIFGAWRASRELREHQVAGIYSFELVSAEC